MLNDNDKELAIGNVHQWHNSGILGDGWLFTTLEKLVPALS